MSHESDSPSGDDHEDDGNPFEGFAIPIPKGLFQGIMARQEAHAEATSKLRVNYDSILQRFRINLQALAEGVDGIDEQLFRIAFNRFHKVQGKLLPLAKFPEPVRKAIIAGLREVLDFVERIPPCPHCGGEHGEDAPHVEGAPAPAAETDPVTAAQAEIDTEEVLAARLMQAGLDFDVDYSDGKTVTIVNPTSVDAIRSFPSFLAALKLDFPSHVFKTK